jgi:male-specific lethal 1
VIIFKTGVLVWFDPKIDVSLIQVWMDIDQMGGSTLQAMAEAVEGADVFLMCMSNKYKHSPACRAGK